MGYRSRAIGAITKPKDTQQSKGQRWFQDPETQKTGRSGFRKNPRFDFLG